MLIIVFFWNKTYIRDLTFSKLRLDIKKERGVITRIWPRRSVNEQYPASLSSRCSKIGIVGWFILVSGIGSVTVGLVANFFASGRFIFKYYFIQSKVEYFNLFQEENFPRCLRLNRVTFFVFASQAIWRYFFWKMVLIFFYFIPASQKQFTESVDVSL